MVDFLDGEYPAIAGALRAALRARVAKTPIPQRTVDAAERLPIEGELRLIEFARRAEEEESREKEEERLREERWRQREKEREKMERAKPN